MAATSRAQRARQESLRAENIAPGMFRVENRSSDSEYIVDIREGVCECPDFRYRVGDDGGLCKHLEYINQVSAGELCAWCGNKTCRPSCPERDSR